MRKSLVSTVAVAMLLAFSAMNAQERQLSLDQAIQAALNNNRDLRIAQLEIDKADAQVTEAFGNALPSLDLTGSYTRNIQNQVFYFPGADGISRPIEIGSANAISGALQLRQVLFNSAVLTGVGTAKTYAQISRQQLRATTAQTVLAVKSAYYGAVLASDVLELNRQMLRNAEQNYETARRFYEAGLRAEFDAIRAEVQVENQRPAVAEALDNYESAIDNLKILLGIPPDTALALTDTLMFEATGDTAVPSVAMAREMLERYNPQLEALTLGTEVNRQLIDINRSEFLPTLALFGAYQIQAQADDFSSLDFQPTSMVGLNLTLNLFNGWQTSARVEQAKIEHQQSQQQLAQLDQALKTQLEAALRRIDLARQRIAVSQRTISQAERGYQIATVAYSAGTGTQLEINDAELALAQSRLNQLNAIFEYRAGLANLEFLLGNNYRLAGEDNDSVIYGR